MVIAPEVFLFVQDCFSYIAYVSIYISEFFTISMKKAFGILIEVSLNFLDCFGYIHKNNSSTE